MTDDGHVRRLERNRQLEAITLAESFLEASQFEDMPGPSARVFGLAAAMLRDYIDALQLLEAVVGALAGCWPDGVDLDLIERAKAFIACEPPPDVTKH